MKSSPSFRGVFLPIAAFAVSSAGAQVVPSRAAVPVGLAAPAGPNLEIVAFTVVPSKPIEGEAVTIKLSIRNAGTTAVTALPWAIHWYSANTTLAKGTQATLAPGAQFDATATWKAVAGQQLLQGYLDAANTLKNTAPVASRTRDASVTVAAAPFAKLELAAFTPPLRGIYLADDCGDDSEEHGYAAS